MATHIAKIVCRHGPVADEDEIEFRRAGPGGAEHDGENPPQFRAAEGEPPAAFASGEVQAQGRRGEIAQAHGSFLVGCIDRGPLSAGWCGPGTTG